MIAKRLLDLALALPAVVLLSPLLLIIAFTLKLESAGPALFRQARVGRFGKPFVLLKFRTMVADAQALGPKVTSAEDPRITRIGRHLRRTKLDELPQLINVARGEMSIVGPRPEVPEYVAHWPDEDRDLILSVPPGLTDYAAIEFIGEETLLKGADDPERTYIDEIMPAKLVLYRKYVANRSVLVDLGLMLSTLRILLMGRR